MCFLQKILTGDTRKIFVSNIKLLGRAQPVIPPNLYSNVNEHNSRQCAIDRKTRALTIEWFFGSYFGQHIILETIEKL